MECLIGYCRNEVVGEYDDYCPYHEIEIVETIGEADYRTWILNHEFYPPAVEGYNHRTSYFSCIRCGELLEGVDASVRHWDTRHKDTVFPDGFPLTVVAQ